VQLEHRANFGTSTVEQHALVHLAQAEQLANLSRFPALHVAQDDHLTLAARQLIDRALGR
jgi:hypothetical protein